MSTYSIAAVERDTGLGKDTLRVWERRYGFPQPARDPNGERIYSHDEVERLQLIKRLLDRGERPNKVVHLDREALRQRLDSAPARLAQAAAVADGAAVGGPGATLLREAIDLIVAHDVTALRQRLGTELARRGLARFVTDVVAPLTTQVGESWLAGELQVHEEHLYTEAIVGVLRAAIGQLPEPAATSRPRVLLTTFVGEPHGLGLLMAQALLALEGCPCVPLGPQTPQVDIARACRSSRADVVALSFTPVLSAATAERGLRDLRAALPAVVEIWAGGSAPVLDRRSVEGVQRVAGLAALAPAVRQWRAAHAAVGLGGVAGTATT